MSVWQKLAEIDSTGLTGYSLPMTKLIALCFKLSLGSIPGGPRDSSGAQCEDCT